MKDDTDIGGGGGRFPDTKLSVIAGLRNEQEPVRARAWETLVTLYWKPVYKYIRIRWNRSNEDAKDLTQAFFLRAMEKSFFDTYLPEKARFRTFLRTCMDGFLSNEDKAARALKRGGSALLMSLDFPGAENELAAVAVVGSPDEMFEKEWVRHLFSVSLEVLRRQCEANGKQIHYRLFERYDVDPDPDRPPSYKDLAAEFGIAVTDVTNYLASVRREFRKIVLERLREGTATEEEYREEARRLLGLKST